MDRLRLGHLCFCSFLWFRLKEFATLFTYFSRPPSLRLLVGYWLGLGSVPGLPVVVVSFWGLSNFYWTDLGQIPLLCAKPAMRSSALYDDRQLPASEGDGIGDCREPLPLKTKEEEVISIQGARMTT